MVTDSIYRPTQPPSARRLPVFGQQWGEVVLIGHERQAGQHVAQVEVRILAMAQAGDDQRVKHRRTLAGFGVADEQPVFLADGGGEKTAPLKRGQAVTWIHAGLFAFSVRLISGARCLEN